MFPLIPSLHDQDRLHFLFQIRKVSFLLPRFWARASCDVLGTEQLPGLSFLGVFFPQNETSKKEGFPSFLPGPSIALWALPPLGVADIDS